MWTLQERIASDQDFYYELIKKINFDLRCAAPAIIKEFDSITQTVTVQLAVREKVIIEGVIESKKVPVLYKVPIYMPRAGNFIITMPITVGDECLVVFADTNFDAWQQNGGEENEQMTQRRHDLTDAIALCGIWSQKNLVDNYSSTNLQIRSLDGLSTIELSDTNIKVTKGVNEINIADDSISLTSTTINLNGTTTTQSGSDTKMEVLGDSIVLSKGSSTITIGASGIAILASTVTINGKDFITHRHADGTGTTPPYVGQTGVVV